jgi:hypothetical protein
MKALYLLAGAILLISALLGILWWIANFEMLQAIVHTNGNVIVQPIEGSKINFHGGWFGLFAVGVPSVLFGAGIWLLFAGFKMTDAKGAE